MAFSIKDSSASYTQQLSGLWLPSRVNLVGEYLFGGTEAESIRNRAVPSNPLIVQGSPTYGTGYATVRSSATTGYGYRTSIIPDVGFTQILVRWNPATTATTLVSMGMSGTGVQWGHRNFGANHYGSSGEGSSNQGANRARPSTSNPFFEAVVGAPSADFGKLYYASAGTVTSVTSATANTMSRTSGINPGAVAYKEIWIGGTGLTDSISTNTQKVMFAAIYNRPLTLAELQTAYTRIAAMALSRFGLTVE